MYKIDVHFNGDMDVGFEGDDIYEGELPHIYMNTFNGALEEIEDLLKNIKRTARGEEDAVSWLFESVEEGLYAIDYFKDREFYYLETGYGNWEFKVEVEKVFIHFMKDRIVIDGGE